MAVDPIALIKQRAQQLGLDPKAVLAVAKQEGLGGGIGDGGHAFGPFQENNAGGVLTGRFPGASQAQLQQWAWSPAGINDALGRIARVAKGLSGAQAINAIVSRFERPQNPSREIANANSAYGLPASAGQMQLGSASAPSAGTAQALAGAVLSGQVGAPAPDPMQNFISYVMANNNALMQRAQPVGYQPF